MKGYYSYEAYGNQLATVDLFLENSYGINFRIVTEPGTPFTVGEDITIKGYTNWWGDKNPEKYGIQIICGARNLPLYEW